jgi:hypothetical protein
MTRNTAVNAEQRAAATPSKLFVLDTNVLMHDPTCVYRFEEHDVFLPMMTLEELDNHKKGMSEIARNARQVTRTLDEIVNSVDGPSTRASRSTDLPANWPAAAFSCRPKRSPASCRRDCRRSRSTTRFWQSSSICNAGIPSVR